MRKILVTGGAGFIGSHAVVELSQAGFEPVILDNFVNSSPFVIEGINKIIGRDISVIEGDSCNETLLNTIFSDYDISGVIHFAALKSVSESVEKPVEYYKNNVGSLISLLSAMKQSRVKDLVFSSSCTVYGQPDILPVLEESPFKEPVSPYGRTKQICEYLLMDSFKADVPVRTISLRYFNPIGAHPTALIGELPLDFPNNLVPYLTQSVAGLRPPLIVFGNDYDTPDGTCIRDYIHVVDLAKAHVKALEYLHSVKENYFFDALNLGTGKGTSVLELIKTFEKATGITVDYKIGERRQGDAEQIFANADKAEKMLKWRTELSLTEALKSSWEWQKKLKDVKK